MTRKMSPSALGSPEAKAIKDKQRESSSRWGRDGRATGESEERGRKLLALLKMLMKFSLRRERALWS